MARGYAVETLHGDLSQAQRDRVMRRFRAGQAEILIATDVAARGLDIPDVSHVFNYDIPKARRPMSTESAARPRRQDRRGRSPWSRRARSAGFARSSASRRARIEPRRLPTVADVAERRREVLKHRFARCLRRKRPTRRIIALVNDLARGARRRRFRAAILKLYAEETGRSRPRDADENDHRRRRVAPACRRAHEVIGEGGNSPLHQHRPQSQRSPAGYRRRDRQRGRRPGSRDRRDRYFRHLHLRRHPERVRRPGDRGDEQLLDQGTPGQRRSRQRAGWQPARGWSSRSRSASRGRRKFPLRSRPERRWLPRWRRWVSR